VVKQSVCTSYGLTGNHTGYCDTNHGCEVDHLISIELGGSNDQHNLWPEPYQGAK
jgi:5-methylcytosine-specific restriction endonuclease McrA